MVYLSGLFSSKPRLSIEDCFKQLDLFATMRLTSNPTLKLLEDLTLICQQERDSTNFGALLSSLEKQRMGKSTTLCEFLFSIAAEYMNEKGDDALAEKWLHITKNILSLFDDEVLQTIFTFRYAKRPMWRTHTSLSLAFHALEVVRVPVIGRDFCLRERGTISSSFQARWKKEIISYLINDRHISPDEGRVDTSPILVYCFEYFSKDEALDHEIIDTLIQLTGNKKLPYDKYNPLNECKNIAVVDRQSGIGVTALGAAVVNHWPLSMLKQLIMLGANVNICFENSMFEFTQVPLLTFAMKSKNYEAMALLLENNADPNQMPWRTSECGEKCGREQFSLLTPFQEAVANDDTNAIALFSKWRKQHPGVKLEAELHQEESDKRLYGWMFMPKGSVTLSRRAETAAIEGPDYLLTELVDKYNLKVYVENLSDKDKVIRLFNTLFDMLTHEAVGKHIAILVNALKKETEVNPSFKFSFMNDSNAMPAHTCGYYNNDTGNEIVLFQTERIGSIEMLVHELGHFFESRHGGLGRIDGFAHALEKEHITHKKIEALPSILRDQLMDSLTLYDRPSAQQAEYFTRICFQIPIKLSLENNNHLQTGDVNKLMKQHFPFIYSWFEKNYLNQLKPVINEPARKCPVYTYSR